MTRSIDPNEDFPIIGEVSDIDKGSFREHLVESIRAKLRSDDKLLPPTHELVTKGSDGNEEIPIKDLIEEDEKGIRTKIIEEIEDHRKEIAITALSAVGLLVAIKHIHARRKK